MCSLNHAIPFAVGHSTVEVGMKRPVWPPHTQDFCWGVSCKLGNSMSTYVLGLNGTRALILTQLVVSNIMFSNVAVR